MIRLAGRLILGTGRDALVRPVVTAAGVAMGVAFLLLAAVAYPALHSHDVRGGWLATKTHNIRPAQDEGGTDPLLFRADTMNFEDRDIIVVDVAALGPRAPIPPGLSRLPGPDRYAVSPALARLMSATPRDMLADRFPGTAAGMIGDAALTGPDQLMIVVGHDPAALRPLTDVREVRSIEGAPVQHGYNDFLRVVLAIGIAGLLTPVVVFVSTATRLSAARRERRLAALRLVGCTMGQVGLLTAVEAGLAAVSGTVLGFAAFTALRPYAARVPFDGTAFFPADLRLSPAWAILISVGVPMLAIAAAQLSLRRLRVSPLGVARQAPRPRPTWRRLILLAVGLTAFVVALPYALAQKGATSAAVALAAAFVLIVLGIVTAGPWLTVAVSSALLRFGRGCGALLAGRRLQANPAGGFRTISGLILAVFVASLVCGALPSALAADPQGKFPMPPGSVIGQFGGHQATGLPVSEGRRLITRLAAVPGVTQVIPIRHAPPGSTLPVPGKPRPPVPVLMRCADLRAATVLHCPDPAAVIAIDLHDLDDQRGTLMTLTRPISAATVRALPPAALVALTDGDPAVIERARTMIYASLTGHDFWVTTSADQDALLKHRLAQLQWLATAALGMTMVIAGCSLAVSVTGGLIERRRPFALLRLAGAYPADLRKVLFTETAAPLLTVAVVSSALGLGLAAVLLKAGRFAWQPPDPLYWVALAGGLLLALGLAMATAFPFLGKLTSPQEARFE